MIVFSPEDCIATADENGWLPGAPASWLSAALRVLENKSTNLFWFCRPVQTQCTMRKKTFNSNFPCGEVMSLTFKNCSFFTYILSKWTLANYHLKLDIYKGHVLYQLIAYPVMIQNHVTTDIEMFHSFLSFISSVYI